MKKSPYSYLLVLIQFSLITALLVINESVFTNWLSACISSLGFIFGIYALIHNEISNFNITPEIKEEAKLITTGAYRYIRHPMYFAVLLIMLGVILTKMSIENTVLYVFLIFVLYLKAKKEENLWLQKTPQYQNYLKQTKMFVPFIL